MLYFGFYFEFMLAKAVGRCYFVSQPNLCVSLFELGIRYLPAGCPFSCLPECRLGRIGLEAPVKHPRGADKALSWHCSILLSKAKNKSLGEGSGRDFSFSLLIRKGVTHKTQLLSVLLNVIKQPDKWLVFRLFSNCLFDNLFYDFSQCPKTQ